LGLGLWGWVRGRVGVRLRTLTRSISAPHRESTAPRTPLRFPLAQAHHHRATDANLLRSGELVDEPGSGSGSRWAYPSLHHVRPASVLRVPFRGATLLTPAWLCMLLAALACTAGSSSGRAAEPLRAHSVCEHDGLPPISRLSTLRPVQHGGVRLRRRVKAPSWLVPSCASAPPLPREKSGLMMSRVISARLESSPPSHV
jgi:hypothetical protein